LIPGRPRSAPPSIPAPIQLLIKHDPQIAEDIAIDQIPADAPVSLIRRAVRTMWRDYSAAKLRLRAPLPQSEVAQLQQFASTQKTAHLETEFHTRLKQELLMKRTETGAFQGRLHRVSPRFLRRRYETFLKTEYIPTFSKEGGQLNVSRVTLVSSEGNKLPSLDRRHMDGYTLSCGTKVGQVDEKGRFINRETG
jgi:hypothetical protein